jgi:hypothetical protein
MGLLIFDVLVLLVVCAVLSIGAWAFYTIRFRGRVPVVATPAAELRELAQVLKLSSADVVVDCGSGNGSAVMALCSQGSRGVGYETLLFPLLLARLKAHLRRLPIQFVRQSCLEANLSSATIIYAYLLPSLLEPLWRHAQATAPPGTCFITRTFPLATATPIAQHTLGRGRYYIYAILEKS